MNPLLRSLFLLALLIGTAELSFAHCDSLNGPVIADARIAFTQGQVTPVLKWVRPSDEPAIRSAFARAVAVRSKGDEARDLAELYFFETLVRLHRASEGAPYTGLKPDSEDPVIASVDHSLYSGNADKLFDDTARHVTAELKRRFERAAAARKQADASVAAGREYVRSYVELVHFVEQLHQPGATEQEPAPAQQHEHK